MSHTQILTQRNLAAASLAGMLFAFTVVMAPGCGSGESTQNVSNSGGGQNGSSGGQASTQSTDDSPGSGTGSSGPVTKPPVISSQALGADTPRQSYEVPDGTPEEIFEFVKQVGNIEPQSAEEQLKIITAISDGCDRLLSIATIAELRAQAADTKIYVLSTLAHNERMAIEQAAGQNSAAIAAGPHETRLIRFCKTLSTDSDPSIARVGKMRTILFNVRDFVQGQNDDYASLKQSLADLLTDKEGHSAFIDFADQVSTSLFEAGFQTQAGEVMAMFGGALKNNENEQIANFASSMIVQSKMLALDFPKKIEAARTKQPGSDTVLLQAVQQLFGPEPDLAQMEIAISAGQNMEVGGNLPAAQQIYQLVIQTYANHRDQELAQTARRRATNGMRRLALIGRPFEVSGVTLDGQPFNWSPYQGRVVLVDFWTTWSPQSMAEISNLRNNLKAFREKGFEVVGINLNEDPERLKSFFGAQQLSWPTVVAADAASRGVDKSPMAVACGIEGAPFLGVLINKQGIVEGIHVRGPRLEKELTRLLGPGKLTTGPGSPNGTPPARAAQRPGTNKSGAIERPRFKSDSTQPSQTFFVSLVGAIAEEDAEEDDAEEKVNPYLAPAGLSVDKLVDFILDMEEKPRSIKKRDGFADAIVDAADRVLAEDAKASYRRLAALSKISILHKRASLGNEKADQQLEKFVEEIAGETDKQIAKEVKFLQLERRVLNVDELTLAQVTELLAELKTFFEAEKLGEKHLRLASSTVHAINRLDSADEAEKEKYGDLREKHFGDFGKLFARSKNKELASYGKKLAKAPKASSSDLVGKPLELEGVTALGAEFNWKAYRGKVVLVDFWATWCGPCRREMPHVKELYKKHKEAGFEVVGVSLDKDLEALAKYIDENEIPWENLAGDGTKQLAEKYGVRGIPTMMLVDQKGNIVAVTHKVGDLTADLEKLLKPQAAD